MSYECPSCQDVGDCLFCGNVYIVPKQSIPTNLLTLSDQSEKAKYSNLEKNNQSDQGTFMNLNPNYDPFSSDLLYKLESKMEQMEIQRKSNNYSDSLVIESILEDLPPPSSPPPVPSIPPPPEITEDSVVENQKAIGWDDLLKLKSEWDKIDEANKIKQVQDRKASKLTASNTSLPNNKPKPNKLEPNKKPSSNSISIEERIRKCWEADIESFYKKHNPDKLSDPNFIPYILQKYRGKETELLAKLQKQYGKSL